MLSSTYIEHTEVSSRSSDLWMRQISFLGLLRILHLLNTFPSGMTAKELDEEITRQRIYLTQRGMAVKVTRLFHCRNTLLRLQAIRRESQRLFVNLENLHVKTLLDQTTPNDEVLNDTARNVFAELVLKNSDCRRHFFDIFLGNLPTCSVQNFRTLAHSVTWRLEQGHRRIERNGKVTSVEVALQNEVGRQGVRLNSETQIQSILYGLRYWARDELGLIDEYFHERRGNVMYPISKPNNSSEAYEVAGSILSMCSQGQEWTTLSLKELTVELCEQSRRPVASLHAAIKLIQSKHPRHVVLIPTSSNFATISVTYNRKSEDRVLHRYFRDAQGRYISHIRIHNSIGSVRGLNHV